jgi:hypothetical protein
VGYHFTVSELVPAGELVPEGEFEPCNNSVSDIKLELKEGMEVPSHKALALSIASDESIGSHSGADMHSAAFST